MNNLASKLFKTAIVLLVVPWFLPKRSRVVQRRLIRATGPDVYPFLADLQNWPLWNRWSCPECVRVEILSSTEDQRIVHSLEICGRRVEGILALETRKHVTRVTWVSQWESPDPYSRYLDAYLRWRMGRDFQAGLQQLQDLVERE